MTDFTLKELYCLENAIHLQLEERSMSQTNYDRRVELRAKLKSMIEDYCEHHKMQAMADESGHLFTKCTDCDYVSWHEKD